MEIHWKVLGRIGTTSQQCEISPSSSALPTCSYHQMAILILSIKEQILNEESTKHGWSLPPHTHQTKSKLFLPITQASSDPCNSMQRMSFIKSMQFNKSDNIKCTYKDSVLHCLPHNLLSRPSKFHITAL